VFGTNLRPGFPGGEYLPRAARFSKACGATDRLRWNISMDAIPLVVRRQWTRLSGQWKPVVELLGATAAGLALCGWFWQARAIGGATLAGQSALLSLLLLTLLIATGLTRLTRRWHQAGLLTAHLLSILCVPAAGILHAAAWNLLPSLASTSSSASVVGQMLLLSGILAPLCLLPFIAAGSCLLAGRPSVSQVTLRLTGAGLSLLLAITLTGYGLDADGLIVVAAGLSAVIVAAGAGGLAFAQRPAHVERATTENAAATVRGTLPDGSWMVIGWLCSVLAGLLLTGTGRLVEQLVLSAVWLDMACVAGVAIGAAAGWFIAARSASPRGLVPLITACAALMTVTLFPAWITLILDVNTFVVSQAQAVLIKASFAALCCLPAGCLAGWSAGLLQRRGLSSHVAVVLIGLLFGLAFLTGSWLLPVAGVPGLLAGSAVALSGLSLWLESRGASGSSRFRLRPVFAGLLIVAVGQLFLTSRYQPELAARLLFDGRVFVARHHEARLDVLSCLDEGRCLRHIEGDLGTVTLWRQRGVLTQVRHSGLPAGITSQSPAIAPLPAGETLPVLLSLALHERPLTVLALGARAGSALQAAIPFPVESVECVDPDRGVVQALREDLLAQAALNPLDDARLTLTAGDPLLTLAARPGAYDLILCGMQQPCLPRSAPFFTAGFLQQAANALQEGGLFCQTVEYFDPGPQAVLDVISTWQSVFEHVGVVEVTPGVLLLAGSRDPQGVFREGLVERLQRSHVRLALTTSGLDWAEPLQLTVLTPERLRELHSATPGTVLTSRNAGGASRFAWELLRRDNKLAVVQTQLNPYGAVLADVVVTETNSRKVRDRLADLKAQRELLRDHPDEFWAYRKTVKGMLLKNDRSELVQVKGEAPAFRMQSEEQRRARYFETLGAAAKQERPSAESLVAVEEFAEPFDPLISVFLHEELAELAARDPDQHADLELRHRLYRAFLQPPSDRSVRNATAAIELICRHPGLLPDDTLRGDSLDALLQILHDHWHRRGDMQPGSSRIVLNDIEKSLAATDRAFTTLDELHAARGLTPEHWQTRQLALEKALVRPLRSYRTTLLPHHQREKKQEQTAAPE